MRSNKKRMQGREALRKGEGEEKKDQPRQPMIEIDLSHVNNWIAVTLYDDSSRLA